jgi:hypothetical protein
MAVGQQDGANLARLNAGTFQLFEDRGSVCIKARIDEDGSVGRPHDPGIRPTRLDADDSWRRLYPRSIRRLPDRDQRDDTENR